MNEEGLSEAVEQRDGQWPQIDSSESVQPASSTTQHPHCPPCQGGEAALRSSRGGGGGRGCA